MPKLRNALCKLSARASVIALPLLMAGTVLAQDAREGAPPSPTLQRGGGAWLSYLIIFVLVAMVVTISLLPSKRSHQD